MQINRKVTVSTVIGEIKHPEHNPYRGFYVTCVTCWGKVERTGDNLVITPKDCPAVHMSVAIFNEIAEFVSQTEGVALS